MMGIMTGKFGLAHHEDESAAIVVKLNPDFQQLAAFLRESQRQQAEQNRPDVLLSSSFLRLFLGVSTELLDQLGDL